MHYNIWVQIERVTAKGYEDVNEPVNVAVLRTYREAVDTVASITEFADPDEASRCKAAGSFPYRPRKHKKGVQK